MEILSVQIQGQGYLLNGTMSVPKADGNKEYELIKQWIKDNTPEPEFTEEELNIQEVQVKLTEYKSYLNSTDFYYPRFLETGESVPEEVVLKRTEAREFIRINKVVV